MLPYEWPSVSVCRRENPGPGSDPLRTVIWIRGEHDVATRMHLTGAIDQAARLDDADVAVDLGGVSFMDASTIGALLVAPAHPTTLEPLEPAGSMQRRAPS